LLPDGLLTGTGNVPVPNLYLSQIVSVLHLRLSLVLMLVKTSELSWRPNSLRANRTQIFCALALLLGSVSFSGCAAMTEKPAQAAPQISVVPNAVEFQNVVVGQKNTQTVQISNSGNANLTVSAVTLTGAGFSLGSITAPFALAPGASKNFTVSFAPTAATNSAKGSISIASDAMTAPFSVPVQGAAVNSNIAWQINPSSVSFTNSAVQTTQTQTATLINYGNMPFTISSVTVSGSAFTTSGLTPGLTLSPQQQFKFQISFHPTVAGTAKGTLSVVSPSAPSALAMALQGSAVTTSNPAPPPPTSQHTVLLTWSDSGANIAGYRVYRGTSSGGPYSQITSSLTPQTTYSDDSVVSGSEYFYVTTAVNSTGEESAHSNEASASIPNP
jgi:hypothetical protein